MRQTAQSTTSRNFDSFEPASPVQNFYGSLTENASPLVQNAPNSAYIDKMRHSDLVNVNMAYEAGTKALELWLSGQFSALERYVSPGDFNLEVPIELDHVLQDSLIAYGKQNQTRLRIWKEVLQKVKDASMFLHILSPCFRS